MIHAAIANGAFEVLILVGVAIVVIKYGSRWLVRDAGRPCPRCGKRVKAGVMRCPSCDFDFDTVGR